MYFLYQKVIDNRSVSKSPSSDYAVKAPKLPTTSITTSITKNLEESLVPERDVSSNHNETSTDMTKEVTQDTAGQLVTNVVVGEDSGFQILSSKDEEAEREKPRKVISTKVHKKKPLKAIHDHRE